MTLIEIFGKDVGFGLRTFRRSPAFSLVAVVTVGLAGVSTAVFGVVKAVLLNPLPYGNPDRIVVIEEPTAGDQLLTETLVLASGGGLLGIALAYLMTAVFASLAPERIPRAESAHVDMAVLIVGIASTLAAGLLFGTAPALSASRMGSTRVRRRNTIMVVEIALAFLLVVGAGLMGRTFQQLVTTGAGFDPNRVLTLTTDVGSHWSRNLIGYYREALEKLHATPGIESAAMTSLLPMDYRVQRNLMISEHPQPNESEQPQAELFSVSTGYFQVMRIPLLRGRLFTERDDAGAEPVALINNALARSKFPVENPIGKHVQVGHSP